MINGIQIVAEARVGNDPELREVSGTQVCNISLAVTERKQNKQTSQWEDGVTTWLRAAVWGPMANNVAVSLQKGMLVNVTGVLSERKYTTDQGAERSQLELRVEMISPSLRFATAQVTPNDRGGNNGGGGGQPQQQWAPAQQQPAWQPGQPPQQAPWQQGPPQQQPVQQQPVQQQAPQQPIQRQPVRSVGQAGPQAGQQWATPAYQGDDVPF